MYILGQQVKGGWYGELPSLDELDENGNPGFTTDFRRVYATMIAEWMGFDRADSILGGDFPGLGVFARSSRARVTSVQRQMAPRRSLALSALLVLACGRSEPEVDHGPPRSRRSHPPMPSLRLWSP